MIYGIFLVYLKVTDDQYYWVRAGCSSFFDTNHWPNERADIPIFLLENE